MPDRREEEAQEVELWTCAVCGDEYDRSEDEPEGVLQNGELYCSDCDDSVVSCDHCGEHVESGSFDHSSFNDGYLNLCSSCCESGIYSGCHHCEEVVVGDTMEDTSDGAVCSACFQEHYAQCDECEEVTYPTFYVGESCMCKRCARKKVENIYRRAAACDDECAECVDDMAAVSGIVERLNIFGSSGNTYTCVSCSRSTFGMPWGNPFAVARALVHGQYADVECRSCYDGSTPSTYEIMNYSFKPVPKFKRTERDFTNRALHFGTEVELDMVEGIRNNRALKQLAEGDKARLFYCKHDVSCGKGFEVVSHPFTFDWMKENQEAFDPMFGLASIMRGHESERCGMHVHMSKDAFTELHMFKFMRFFHLNINFIRSLARRPTGKFERWAKIVAPERSTLMKFTLNRERFDFQRGALNVELDDTIECRIFRSTLSPTAYYGNVEFLQGLFDYTKNCGADDEQLSEQRFMDYVHDRGKSYKNFVLLTETVRPEVEDNLEFECA